jgi:hypothetical protein
MGFKFNPFTLNLDAIHDNTAILDTHYVNVDGDTMTGELDMQDNAIILEAPNGGRYKVTVANDGSLVTTAIVAGDNAGSPMGLLLILTYA